MLLIKQYITWLLLLIFSLIITPRELIHEFCDHVDTHCHPGTRLSFETHHHHCEILQLASLVFTSPEKINLIGCRFSLNDFFQPAVSRVNMPVPVYFNLRAPPLG